MRELCVGDGILAHSPGMVVGLSVLQLPSTEQ